MPRPTEQTPKSCEQCGQPHVLRGTDKPSCKGHWKSDPMHPCGQPRRKGQLVCRKHGANTERSLAAAERRLAEEAATELLAKTLADAYGNDIPQIDPAEAMLQAVSWKYAEVVAWRSLVATLSLEDRTWGVSRKKFGGEDHGTTMESKPHIWHLRLETAEDRLVKYSAAARAAGCDEARVRLAEDQGRMVASTIQGITADLLAWITGVLEAEHRAALTLLVDAWAEKVREFAVARLRTITVLEAIAS